VVTHSRRNIRAANCRDVCTGVWGEGHEPGAILANSLATHETSTRWVRVGGGQKRLWQGGTGAAIIPLSDSAGMVNSAVGAKGCVTTVCNTTASSSVMEKLHNIW
jgi:hypothetical protein